MIIQLKSSLIDASAVALTWSCQLNYDERLENFTFAIYASRSTNGPWRLIEENLTGFGYFDNKTQRYDLQNTSYYQVTAFSKNKEKYYNSNIVTLEENEKIQYALYIAKQEDLLLRRYNGSKALHFAKIKFGKKCPKCYDEVTYKSTKDNCDVCYGSTYDGGYYYPTLIWINTDPKQKFNNKSDLTVEQNTTLTGWTSNRAIIDPDDVIVFLENKTERYIVNQVLPTGLANVTTKQQLVMSEQKFSHPIYKLPINVDLYTLEDYNVFRRVRG